MFKAELQLQMAARLSNDTVRCISIHISDFYTTLQSLRPHFCTKPILIYTQYKMFVQKFYIYLLFHFTVATNTTAKYIPVGIYSTCSLVIRFIIL